MFTCRLGIRLYEESIYSREQRADVLVHPFGDCREVFDFSGRNSKNVLETFIYNKVFDVNTANIIIPKGNGFISKPLPFFFAYRACIKSIQAGLERHIVFLIEKKMKIVYNVMENMWKK